MYSLLDTDEWFILDSCETLIEAIPQLVRHPFKREDVVKPKGSVLSDDCGDSMRYAIGGHLVDPNEKSEREKAQERIAKIEDPLRKHVEMYKGWVKEQHASDRPQTPKFEPSWMRRVRG
jgi:hypothetical protein